MFGGRSRLPVLAEISRPAVERSRAWSLRRDDHERLQALLPRLAEHPVLLVSGDEEAGRLVALSCAAACAAAGRRTVLVECALERPLLAADLGLSPAPGLHEYLRWEAKAEEVVQPVVLAGSAAGGARPLICVVGGRPAANARTLLGLQSFAHMTAKLRSAYEQVVIVGPPALSAPEPLREAAAQADAVLAGLPSGLASGRQGRGLRSAIRALPVPSLGAVAVSAG
jgi:Mrp family chromosome partitioning ATPase